MLKNIFASLGTHPSYDVYVPSHDEGVTSHD